MENSKEMARQCGSLIYLYFFRNSSLKDGDDDNKGLFSLTEKEGDQAVIREIGLGQTGS